MSPGEWPEVQQRFTVFSLYVCVLKDIESRAFAHQEKENHGTVQHLHHALYMCMCQSAAVNTCSLNDLFRSNRSRQTAIEDENAEGVVAIYSVWA